MKTMFLSMLGFLAVVASLTPPACAQQVDDYRYYSWSALSENWDVDNALVFTQPTSGVVVHDTQGNLVYQNLDSSSETDSFEVMMTAEDLVASVTVTIEKSTGSLVYKFTGENTKPRGNTGTASGTSGGTIGSTTTVPGSTVTGTVVGLPGSNAPIPVGGTVHVFVTDDTVPGDSWGVWWDLGGSGVYHDGVKDWTEIRDDLFPLPSDSVDVIVLSGHGSYPGGVQSSGGDITAGTLTDSACEVIKGRAAPGAVVVICGCSQGSAGYVEGIQDLSDKLGLPVIVNTGAVSSGTNGAGTWIEVSPTPTPPSGANSETPIGN